MHSVVSDEARTISITDTNMIQQHDVVIDQSIPIGHVVRAAEPGQLQIHPPLPPKVYNPAA